MNIKGRVKKLENRIYKNFSFCECFEIQFTKLADEIYNNIPSDVTDKVMPDGDNCDKCGKPVSSYTKDFYKSLEMIYG